LIFPLRENSVFILRKVTKDDHDFDVKAFNFYFSESVHESEPEVICNLPELWVTSLLKRFGYKVKALTNSGSRSALF